MNADDDAWASDQQPVVRADFRKLSPLRSSAPIPPPDRRWSATEWAAIRRGHRSRDMDDRWHAFVEGDRLYLHRSWTGHGVYEARFGEADGGWRITEALVCADATTYRRGSDAYESLMLEWVIGGVLLDRWDNQRWQRIQRHRR